MSYKAILVNVEAGVGCVQFNRPEALNALSRQLMTELVAALREFTADSEVRCILITGNDKAFAAGADIKEMMEAGAVDMYLGGFSALWDAVYEVKKPLIAAVSGYAFGGGCELAMICDIIVASETAQFGQPEINIGGIPGAGGTQRLTRAVGKSLAMDMVLSGRRITAQEALATGLVSRVVPVEALLAEAMKLAKEIAVKSPVALQLAKEAILESFESPLSAGVRVERTLSHLTFATDDQKEGMRAFSEKRKPFFKGK
ncbi:enoyl-CoA hydratase [Paenibacillus sp. 7124]|uniref:Probable enoyl-CoA hydratase echA8 n=1 Tax=Paenibacillus apii TaxID=1850370 RepID=A0A6M1PJ70_9BACL|nr:enoyl-CoA hydratase-related protein [Paenibacillus apii]NGM82438.1 enoyl-CoA hydratase [Paenibacillus apii]NJJ39575.1 enoyl-CoA hydratase [Paenibacillus apii]